MVNTVCLEIRELSDDIIPDHQANPYTGAGGVYAMLASTQVESADCATH